MESHNHKLYNGPLAKVKEEQMVNKTNVLLNYCDYVLKWSGMKIDDEFDKDVSLLDQKVADVAMPEGWNGSFPCRMRYLHGKTLYLLTIHPAEDEAESIILNLNRPFDNKTAVSKMNLNEIPKLKGGHMQTGLPNWTTIRQRLKHELIDPFLNNPPSPPAPSMIVERKRDYFIGFIPPSPPSPSILFERANPPAQPAATDFYSKPPAPARKLVELPFNCFPAGATLPPPRGSGGGRGRGRF